MNYQPPQRFCTTCGQPLAPGATFCVACGTRIGAPMPGQPLAGAQSAYQAQQQIQTQEQNEEGQIMEALAAGYLANRAGQIRPRRRVRRSLRSRASGCGCVLLIMVALIGPFVGVALTTGILHTVFLWMAGTLFILLLLIGLLALLRTKEGREALTEGCLDAILGGLFGGG